MAASITAAELGGRGGGGTVAGLTVEGRLDDAAAVTRPVLLTPPPPLLVLPGESAAASSPLLLLPAVGDWRGEKAGRGAVAAAAAAVALLPAWGWPPVEADKVGWMAGRPRGAGAATWS